VSNQISSIRPIALPELASPAADAASSSGEFGAIFQNVLNQVSGAHLNADNNVSKFLKGDTEELHSVVIDAFDDR